MESPNTSLDYYILKAGKTLGPLTLANLEAGLADGRYKPEDLFQTGDEPMWRPLSEIIEVVAEEAVPVAPDWKCISKLAWLRLRHNVQEQSVQTGAICLAAGALTYGLTRWPAIFLVPWLAIAVAAGVILIRRRREMAGTILLLGVLGVPFLFAVIDARMASRKAAVTEAPQNGVGGSSRAAPAEWLSTAPPSGTAVEAVAPPPIPSGLPGAEGSGSDVESKPALAQGDVASNAPSAPLIASIPVATPSVAPAPQTAPPSVGSADVVQSHIDAFVIVKGQEGSGSGFVCRGADGTWLYTNIHVAADLKQPVFTRLNNAPVVAGAAEAAAGPDIVRYALAQPPAHPLEMLPDVDANVQIGDEVIVLGNSGGGGVVTSLPGVVKGLGPDRIEVTAEFIPGNSGSPIIHVKTGKVIGIATYLTRRFDEFASGGPGTQPPKPTPRSSSSSSTTANTPPIVIRRFGYRIDKVPQWEPVNWTAFRGEAAQVHEMTILTADIIHFLNALRKGETPKFATETLSRAANAWISRIGDKHVSESDRVNATQRFLGSLRAMARGDGTAVETRLRYTYFRNELRDEQQVRDQLYDVFDKESASLIAPSTVHSAHSNHHYYVPPPVAPPTVN